jgi:hypothetical protein
LHWKVKRKKPGNQNTDETMELAAL